MNRARNAANHDQAGLRTYLSFPPPSRFRKTSGDKTSDLRICRDVRLEEAFKKLFKFLRDSPQRDCPGFSPGSLLMARANQIAANL